MTELGDRVKLTRSKSVHWFTGAHMRDNPMPITGHVIAKDLTHIEGLHARPFLIKFDDGRTGWYDSWEFVEIKDV